MKFFIIYFFQYIKEEESELAHKLLSDINEWYEEDGYIANLTVLEGKFKQIKKNFTITPFSGVSEIGQQYI